MITLNLLSLLRRLDEEEVITLIEAPDPDGLTRRLSICASPDPARFVGEIDNIELWTNDDLPTYIDEECGVETAICSNYVKVYIAERKG